MSFILIGIKIQGSVDNRKYDVANPTTVIRFRDYYHFQITGPSLGSTFVSLHANVNAVLKTLVTIFAISAMALNSNCVTCFSFHCSPSFFFAGRISKVIVVVFCFYYSLDYVVGNEHTGVMFRLK